MGYKRRRKVFTLRFDGDDELDGLEVQVRSLNLRVFKELHGMGDVDRSDIGSALDEFAQALVSWNLLDEDGQPVPATAEAVLEEDADQMMKIAARWLDVLRGVPKGDPLPESSPAGGPSPEAQIPMEPLSESQAS